MADIELDEVNRENGREAEEANAAEGGEETSFDDDNRAQDELTPGVDRSRPSLGESRPSCSIPNIRQNIGVMKRAVVLDKKKSSE